jgi:hypothetical protein
MFAIEKQRRLPADFDIPVITEGYEVLHFDERPILFTGFNTGGSRLLCSFVEESTRPSADRFFYTIVSSSEYSDFVLGRLTYREILLANKHLFVVDEYYDGSRRAYLVDVARIPTELLPSEDSYFPKPRLGDELGFGARLRGSIADEQQADPGDLRVVEDCLPAIVTDGLEALNVRDLVPRVTIGPYAGGSFRLGFTVATEWKSTLPLFGSDEYYEFANQYVDYCVNHFQYEGEYITSVNWKETAPRFSALLSGYKAIARGVGAGEHAAELLQRIRKSVERLQDLTAIIGHNFTTVELRSVTDAGDNIIGVLDGKTAERIANSAEMYDVNEGHAREDESDREYKIIVYNLNVESRRGHAYVIEDAADSLSRVRFRVSGTEPLEGSPFTASLDKTQKIIVVGRGKYVSNKIRTLMISHGPDTIAR